MQAIPDLQNAHYAPSKGPPMLPNHEPNPHRRPRRKRRKISHMHTPFPQRPKEQLPGNLPASQLPESFPEDLAYRALASYALLRTLSCELRLSPFTPNVFLRALNLPYPNKLLGQIHCCLLRILLSSLGMGYHCKAKGGNVPGVVFKKRKIDGMRWPLRGGDNLTFLDNYTWPLFYDDYVHLTADMIWATLNDDENHVDFKSIGMPDTTGMIMEEDIYEEEEEPLMSKAVHMFNQPTHNTFRLNTLGRLSRSSRRTQFSYAPVDSDEESFEEDHNDDEANNDDDEEYIAPSQHMPIKRGKRGRPRKNPLSCHTPASRPSLPTPNSSGRSSKATIYNSFQVGHFAYMNATGRPSLPVAGTNENLSFHVAGMMGQPTFTYAMQNSSYRGFNGVSMPFHFQPSGQTPGVHAAAGRHPIGFDGYRHDAMPWQSFPNDACWNDSVPGNRKRESYGPGHEGVTSRRSPTRKLPMNGNIGRPPVKKFKRSPMAGSKVEWVERPTNLCFGKTNLGGFPHSKPDSKRSKDCPQHVVSKSDGPEQLARDNEQTQKPDVSGNSMKAVALIANQAKEVPLGQAVTTTGQEDTIAPEVVSSGKDVCENLKNSKGVHKPVLPANEENLTHASKNTKANALFDKLQGITRCSPSTPKADMHSESALGSKKGAADCETEEKILKAHVETVRSVANYKTEAQHREVDVSESSNVAAENTKAYNTSSLQVENSTLSSDSLPENHDTLCRGDDVEDSNEKKNTSQIDGGSSSNCSLDMDHKSTVFSVAGRDLSLSMEPPEVPAKGKPPLKPIESGKISDEVAGISDDNMMCRGNKPFSVRLQALECSSNVRRGVSINPSLQISLPDHHEAEHTLCAAPSLHGMAEEKSFDMANNIPVSAAIATAYNSTAASSSKGTVSLSKITTTQNQLLQTTASPVEKSQLFANAAGSSRSTIVSKLSMKSAGKQNNENHTEKQQKLAEPKLDFSSDGSYEPNTDDETLWQQFQPLKTMRSGTPYHRLSVKEKLTVLEFLLDELLCVDAIASIFTQRYNEKDGSIAKYGCLPSREEIELLRMGTVLSESACKLKCSSEEADLICCDGCTSSYHRACIGMKQNEKLPEGIWLCPETEIVDSANFGPLLGGKKPFLDWFTIENIVKYNIKEHGGIASSVHHNGKTGGVVESKKEHNVSELAVGKNQDASSLNFSPMNNICQSDKSMEMVAVAKNNKVEDGQGKSSGMLSKITPFSGDEEYLIVHGFVFSRSGHNKDTGVSCNPRMAVHDTKRVPLSPEALSRLLKMLGEDLVLAWPFAQIPCTSLEGDGQSLKRSIEHPNVIALDSKASYDPSHYTNKYRKTPLPKLFFPGGGSQSTQLLQSDYETVCSACNVKRLSDRLPANMTGDKTLAHILQTEVSIFDPYQMIRDYMLKLESVLNKSFLVNMFWGTRNRSLNDRIWQTNVRNCKSVPRLAQLLLKLVDATHRRAFAEHWFVIGGTRDNESHPDDSESLDQRFFNTRLAPDWSPDGEMKKRRWERSCLSDIRRLLARENSDVESFVYGKGKVESSRRKRKQAIAFKSTHSPDMATSTFSNITVQEPIDEDMADAMDGVRASTNCGNSKKMQSDGESNAKVFVQELQNAIDKRVSSGIPLVREPQETLLQNSKASSNVWKSCRSRRSGRLQRAKMETPDDFLANVMAESGTDVLPMETLIEAQKMSKLVEIKEVSALPFCVTRNWPVAGRLLFDPAGSIPPEEMKRLGRNAGTVRAQCIKYTGSYEVGEVSHFHVWRKKMERCDSFEKLLFLIRALESNLDRHTISSCEALARRSNSARAQVTKVVRCTQKDLLTGALYYFVAHKSKSRGCWVSSSSIDLSPLIAERSQQREKVLDSFDILVQAKRREEAHEREAARAKAAAEAAVRARALMKEQAAAREKKAKEHAETKRKQKEAKEVAKKLKEEAKLKRQKEKMESRQKKEAEKAALKAQKERASGAISKHKPGSMQWEIEQRLLAHQTSVQELIQLSSRQGLKQVPGDAINELRQLAMAQLQQFLKGKDVNSILALVDNAEKRALEAETKARVFRTQNTGALDGGVTQSSHQGQTKNQPQRRVQSYDRRQYSVQQQDQQQFHQQAQQQAHRHPHPQAQQPFYNQVECPPRPLPRHLPNQDSQLFSHQARSTPQLVQYQGNSTPSHLNMSHVRIHRSVASANASTMPHNADQQIGQPSPFLGGRESERQLFPSSRVGGLMNTGMQMQPSYLFQTMNGSPHMQQNAAVTSGLAGTLETGRQNSYASKISSEVEPQHRSLPGQEMRFYSSNPNSTAASTSHYEQAYNQVQSRSTSQQVTNNYLSHLQGADDDIFNPTPIEQMVHNNSSYTQSSSGYMQQGQQYQWRQR